MSVCIHPRFMLCCFMNNELKLTRTNLWLLCYMHIQNTFLFKYSRSVDVLVYNLLSHSADRVTVIAVKEQVTTVGRPSDRRT